MNRRGPALLLEPASDIGPEGYRLTVSPDGVRVAAAPSGRPVEVLTVDRSLDALARLDPRQGEIVELRFFGGLSIDETAAVLGISPATVKREWTAARAWLFRELSRDGRPTLET